MNVRIIEADVTGDLRRTLAEREKLGQEIAALAQRLGETVYFHEFTQPVGGAPVILLECSEAFLAEARKLPSYRNDEYVWNGPAFETQRSKKLQSRYCGALEQKGPEDKNLPPPPPTKPPAPSPCT